MFNNKKILVADDSETMRLGVQKILEHLGYNYVESAVDGLDAKEKITSGSYDLVILDYNMPGLNGKQVLAFIKKQFPDLLVVILSSTVEPDVIVELMRSASNFVIKDSLDCIKNTLSRVLHRTFEEDFLKKENERLINEIKKRDEITKMELHSARLLIDRILPKKSLQTPSFDIQIFNRASYIIGGDFYFTKELTSNLTYVLLADVCGHGIPAALFLFSLKTAIDQACDGEVSPELILQKLNTLLTELLPSEQYITCVSCVLDNSSKSITFSNSSQNSLLYLKKDNTTSQIDDENVPMLCIEDFDYTFGKSAITLQPGERLFLLTDGITEAQQAGNKEEQFGAESLEKSVIGSADQNLKDSVSLIYKDALEFSDNNIEDDATIIGIQAL